VNCSNYGVVNPTATYKLLLRIEALSGHRKLREYFGSWRHSTYLMRVT